MTSAQFIRPGHRLAGNPSGALLLFLWGGISLFALAAITVLGPWALMLPVYAVALALAVVRPQVAAAGILLAAITLEPGAIDFTKPLSDGLWQMPPGFENLVGLTTSPLEVFTVVAAASALLTMPSSVRLPAIAWAVPLVIVMGLLYGWSKGGATNLAYNEARGLLVGVAVFVLAARVLPKNPSALIKPVMFAEATLALVILVRYAYFVRGGRISGPIEFGFSHEGSVILGAGVVVGAVACFRNNASNKQRIVSALYCLLLVAAMVASGRRAATLVLLVGAVSMGALMLPRRPMLVLAISIPILLASGAYLGAYWNKEYGAMAQPARAIRSQFDPTLRDESSDQYRTIEKYNVIQTIRTNRLFGVGFGRPFYQFEPLPNLEAVWSLQQYTPHQNVLWLWLKMGVLGIGTILAFATVAMSRALSAVRAAGTDEEWALAAVAFSIIAMFLMYSTVDLGFIGPRSVAPAVIACAIAFSLRNGAAE